MREKIGLFVVLFFIYSLQGQNSPQSIFGQAKLSEQQKMQVDEILQEVEQHWLDEHGLVLRWKTEKQQVKRREIQKAIILTAQYHYLLWRLDLLQKEKGKQVYKKIHGLPDSDEKQMALQIFAYILEGISPADKADYKTQNNFRKNLLYIRKLPRWKTQEKLSALMQVEMWYAKGNEKNDRAIKDFIRWIRIVHGDDPLQQMLQMHLYKKKEKYILEPEHPLRKLASFLSTRFPYSSPAPVISTSTIHLSLKTSVEDLSLLATAYVNALVYQMLQKDIPKDPTNSKPIQKPEINSEMLSRFLGKDLPKNLRLPLEGKQLRGVTIKSAILSFDENIRVTGEEHKIKWQIPTSFKIVTDSWMAGTLVGSSVIELEIKTSLDETGNFQYEILPSFRWIKSPGMVYGSIIGASINKHLETAKADLETMAKKYLAQMPRSFPISLPAAQAWAELEPKSLYIAPLEIDKEVLYAEAMIVMSGKLALYNQSPKKEPMIWPEMIQGKLPEKKDTEITIPVIVEYKALEEALRQITRKEIEKSGQISLDYVKIWGLDGWLVITLKMTSEQGTFVAYLSTRPIIEGGILSVEKLQTHISTHTAKSPHLPEVAKFGLRDEIPLHLRLPVNQMLGDLQEEINHKITQYNARHFFQVKGGIDSIKIGQLHIGTNRMLALVTAKGKTTIELVVNKDESNK